MGRGSMEEDVTYFSRRAREEREAAMKTPNSLARDAHCQLAERYDEMVQAIKSHATAAEMSISE
jgi:hypothetical protein